MLSRHNRQVVISQCRLRHASASLSPVARRNWAATSPSSLVAYQLSARLLSTSSPPPGKAKTGDASPPPLPASTPSASKPKVQLRPAPVKPPPKLSTAPPEPVPAPTETSLAGAKSTASPEATKAPTHEETLVEATKHDLEDASQHGILVPPPADASWAGKLWHQAKELFVRTLHLPTLL